MKSRRHQSGDMSHVHHKVRPHLFGDLRHPGKIYDPCVGRSAGHDHLRAAFLRCLFQKIVVDALRFLIHTVRNDLKPFAGHIHRAAVGEMAAVGEIHAHHRIAGREEGEEHRHIRLRPRMGLHVGVPRTEEGLRPVDGQLFRPVNELTAAVIALARIAFGIFIGQDAALRLHDRSGYDVLRSDEFQFAPLPRQLVVDVLFQLRVRLCQRVH